MGMLRCILSGLLGRVARPGTPVPLEVLLETCTYPERGVCRTECTVCLPEGNFRFDTRLTGVHAEGDILTCLDHEALEEGDWEVVRVVSGLLFGTSLRYDQVEVRPLSSPTEQEVLDMIESLETIGGTHGP